MDRDLKLSDESKDAVDATRAESSEDLPVGVDVPGWQGASLPSDAPLSGNICRLERLKITHGSALFNAYASNASVNDWLYLPYGPFESEESFEHWVAGCAANSDPHFYAIVDKQSDEAVGVASYLRIVPVNGVIEVGHIHYAPVLQRTAAATEAMYLMMRNAFALGYRRYEWKCDALNARSRRAAERLGFTFEGVFRQASVYKGRNRDTAWYAIIDSDWPAVKQGFERWLASSNRETSGRPRLSLGQCRDAGV